MPKFFDNFEHLSESDAAHTLKVETVELAGIAAVLLKNSANSTPKASGRRSADAERGKNSSQNAVALHAISMRRFRNYCGLWPKHQRHTPKINAIRRIYSLSDWLYTWIREPQRYHSRSKMPNLYLDAYKEGTADIYSAAHIAAFLLSQGAPGEFPVL